MSYTVPPAAATAPSRDAVHERIARGLSLVTVPFPYLAGLAAATRVTLDERVPTMGVFASGRLVANPGFVARLNDADLAFVLAHEMLHLALRTHDRLRGSDPLEFNYAHDYIINDMLRAALGRTTVPAGGLDLPGARERSAEEIVLEMRRNAQQATRTRVWEGQETTHERRFRGRGRGEPDTSGRIDVEGRADAGDVLGEARERELYPDDPADPAREAEATRERAAKALQLARATGALGRGDAPGGTRQVVDALRGLYRAPWTEALQRWLESVAPGERTFTRASRRGIPTGDVVLPGRRREGWVLNVVLDTSGSMEAVLPQALGAIADFCDVVAVEEVRVVQCDAQVTADARMAPPELARMTVDGYGGSDLTPAFAWLADDPQVTAVLVLTDGEIAYPSAAPPFAVLWALVPGAWPDRFAPPYGRVVPMTLS